MTPAPPFTSFKTVEDYIDHLKKEKVKTIVVLLTSLEEFGLIRTYKKAGLNVIHFPITDFSIPDDMKELSATLHQIRKSLKKHNVAMHCYGGNGRTGLVVASMLVQMGVAAQKAISFVRKYRPEAIETSQQERFISSFEFFTQFVEKKV